MRLCALALLLIEFGLWFGFTRGILLLRLPSKSSLSSFTSKFAFGKIRSKNNNDKKSRNDMYLNKYLNIYKFGL